MSSFFARFDSFRRVDKDFANGTYHGAIITCATWAVMLYLSISEFSLFYYGDLESEVGIEENTDSHVEINFNITMMDLPCKYTVINVWDAFEDYEMNVTDGIMFKQNMHWERGVLQNGEWVDDKEDDKQKLEEDAEAMKVELDKEGHHAIDLSSTEDLDQHLKDYRVVMVNFYASWCIWSQRLKPTWEVAATRLDKMHWVHRETKVKMVAMDCAKQGPACRKHNIRAFPTLVLYVDGKPIEQYEEDRRVDSMLDWLVAKAQDFESHLPNVYKNTACRIGGVLTVPRVPGNFIIVAEAKDSSLSPSMTNVSHIVHNLSFGQGDAYIIRSIVNSYFRWVEKGLAPLNGKIFNTDNLHTAPQHYIKVVSSTFKLGSAFSSGDYRTNQMTTQNRIRKFHEDAVPEAKFSYTFSPIHVMITNRGQSLYHFVTNMCAILGGTYSILSLTNLMMNNLLFGFLMPNKPLLRQYSR